jgi:outer membrane lipoprotein SlyB
MDNWKPASARRASAPTANGKSTTAKRLLIAVSLPLALAACGGTTGRTNTYTSDAAQKVSLVERGQVLSVRKVAVSGNNSQVGTMTGIGAGAIGGSAVGGDWRSNALGAIGGAVIGGVGGAAVDSVVNEQVGYEYLFQIDGGKLQSLTQVDSEPLPVGQRVLLIQGPPARLIVDTLGLPPKAAAETVTAPPPAAPAPTPAFTITVTPVQPATVTATPAAPVVAPTATPPAATSISSEPIAPPVTQPASVTPEPAAVEAAPLAPPPAAPPPETPAAPASEPVVVPPPTEPTP